MKRAKLIAGIIAVMVLISGCTNGQGEETSGGNSSSGKTISTNEDASTDTAAGLDDESEASSQKREESEAEQAEESNVENSEESEEGLLTEEEALEIAKEIINPDEKPDLIVDINRSMEVEGEPFYILHEYYSVMHDGWGQTFTMGWYAFNRKTGELYECYAASTEKENWILLN